MNAAFADHGPFERVIHLAAQAGVRAAYKSRLGRVPNCRGVGDAGDSRAGSARVQKVKPDVVVLDITMPGLSGIDAVTPLKKASPQTRVLMASQHEGTKFVQQALQVLEDVGQQLAGGDELLVVAQGRFPLLLPGTHARHFQPERVVSRPGLELFSKLPEALFGRWRLLHGGGRRNPRLHDKKARIRRRALPCAHRRRIRAGSHLR